MTERDLLVKLNDMFTAALDHPAWKFWREEIAIQCHKYKEGEQWTPAELTRLKERHQPPTVNNQTAVTINRMIGQFVKQKSRIGYRPRNQPVDETLSNALSDIFLFIHQQNELEFEERDLVDDGFTAGFGCLEVFVTFDDAFQPEIRIQSEDSFNVFPDPYSRRYDWNRDAKYVCRAKWVHLDELEELYPGKKKELGQLMDESFAGLLGGVDSFKKENYVDYRTRRVRPVEIQYKIREKQSIYLFENGDTLDVEKAKKSDLAGRTFKKIDRLSEKIRLGVFTGGVLLEEKETDQKFFSFIPYFMYRRKSGEPYSLIWIALTMQEAINKRESKALHLLNTNQTIAEENAIPDEDKYAEEIAKADGIATVKQGALRDKRIEIRNNLELASTQFQMHRQAQEDYRRITGINPDALGEPSEVRSGIGIARKTAMTDLIVAPVYDNIRRTRRILARVVLDRIQKYYNEPKTFLITDSLQATREVKLDEKGAEALKQGTYDVIVEDMPDVTTIHQEQFGLLAQTLPQILPFGSSWAKFLIQMSDLRNKDDYLKAIDEQMQPVPTKPRISASVQLDQVTPIERAAFWEEMGRPDVAQMIRESGVPPTTMLKEQAKSQAASAKNEMELRKIDTETRAKEKTAELDIAKKEMELAGMMIDTGNSDGKRIQGIV